METLTIADAAEATGFTASALRFYEDAGLVQPGRTGSGYRIYGERELATLRFIGRAKRFGLSLEEIAELVPMLDAGRCGPVQEQLRAFVEEKIAENRRRVTDAIAFVAQLRQMAAWLDGHTADGPCDDRCGCTSDPAHAGTLIPVTGSGPIACTLAPERMDDRMAAWRQVTDTALEREPIEGGVRLLLPPGTDVAAVARLMVDEQACCSFFTFSLTVGPDGVWLDTRAPDEAHPVVLSLLGAA